METVTTASLLETMQPSATRVCIHLSTGTPRWERELCAAFSPLQTIHSRVLSEGEGMETFADAPVLETMRTQTTEWGCGLQTAQIKCEISQRPSTLFWWGDATHALVLVFVLDPLCFAGHLPTADKCGYSQFWLMALISNLTFQILLLQFSMGMQLFDHWNLDTNTYRLRET